MELARDLGIDFLGCKKYWIIGSLISEVIYMGFYYAGPKNMVPYNQKSLISKDFYTERHGERLGLPMAVPYKRVSLISE